MAIRKVKQADGKFIWMDGDQVMNPQPKSADEALEMANARNEELAAKARNGNRAPMVNIDHKLDGSKLTLVIDLSQDNGPSSSGRTKVVATTKGNVPFNVPGVGQVFVGINAYRK